MEPAAGAGAAGGGGAGGLAEARIPLADVTVVEGAEGLIGRGALGEVRRGRFDGADVALKGLLKGLLAPDPQAKQDNFGGIDRKA